jgi:hypothetical protein
MRFVIYHTVWYHLWPTIFYILYHTVWFRLWVASRNLFRVYHTFWYCRWLAMCCVLYYNIWKRFMDNYSQYVSLDTIQSGIPCGPQFATFYTIQVGSTYGAQICNKFHCIQHSRVSLVVHNLLRFIPYGLGSLKGRNSQCFPLDHSRCVDQDCSFEGRWFITLGGLLKIPLAWILTRVQVTVVPVVVPGHPPPPYMSNIAIGCQVVKMV